MPSTCATDSRSSGNASAGWTSRPGRPAASPARPTASPKPGAIWVDEQLAHRGPCGPVILDRLVAHAIATYDPEEHEDRENKATADSDVTLTHPEAPEFAGTSHLDAHGDTLTLKAFHDLVCTIAHQLHVDGDTNPLGVRKITAIGIITTLATGLATGHGTGQGTLDLPTQRVGKIEAFLRVDARDLDTPPGDDSFAVGQVEKLGAATLAMIRAWVGHHQVSIQPVLNMARRDAVDQHDPPSWLRDLVQLRDGHRTFPRCTIDARSCDLDHTTPYQPDGPPGQTRAANLACLCRRHHRAKTSGRWSYWRTPDGDYLWHGPYGTTYLVTPRGAHRLP